MLEAQDDAAEIGESDGAFEIRQQTWKLMANVADYHPACASALAGLFEGLAGRLRPPHRRAFEARRRGGGRQLCGRSADVTDRNASAAGPACMGEGRGMK